MGRATAWAPATSHFTDSRHPFDYDFLTNWKDVFVRLSEQFVRRWVRNPIVMEGRLGDSQWGRVLSSYFAQLSPEFFVHAPLPQAVLLDQLGALLALTASERKRGPRRINASRTLRARPRLRSHPTALRGYIPPGGRHCEFAQHIHANPASGARGLWRHVRSDADPGSRRSRGTDASIAAVRSRDHSGDRATSRILGCLPLREGPAQAHRPDAAADAPSQPRNTDRTVGDIR